jgi:hypothetical protein
MIELFRAPSIEMPSSRRWFFDLCRQLVPRELAEVVAWADANYRVVNKDRDMFSSEDSPWLLEPLRMADDPLVSRVTYVKPVQCGAGTSLGEIMVLRWILGGNGLIGYYWPTNDKAKDRWEKWTERRIRACKAVHQILPRDYENLLIRFPAITFSMAGVFTPGNLDSDTVDYVLCEEVHEWAPGMLAKAKGRQTKVDFPKFIVVSNAGVKGDQLHQEFNEGTQQHFEVRCPGCRKYHVMRTRWEENQPALGGLRYDSDGCKRSDGTFDYNRLVPTIRFQMPCGYELRDDVQLRRAAAAGGRYSEPFNTGALLAHRSYTLQAVACHTMRWLDLIQEKHIALRALKTGDDKNWRQYLQERESIFYDPDEHRPFQGAVVLTESARVNRQGLPKEIAKFYAFDWQQGFKHLGELTHYWGVIESVMENCSSQVIWAGKVDDEMELLSVLREHGITDSDLGGIFDGFIDASKNTKHILSFCYRAGINAVMGNASGKGLWKWPDGEFQYYSPKKFIYKELNMPPKYDLRLTREGYVEDPSEPFIIMYSKAGILKNHFFIQEMKANVLANKPDAGPDEYIERVVPEDIGDDYLHHHEAWERDLKATAPKGMGQVEGFKQTHRVDHLMSCTCYIDLEKDLTGLLGNELARLGIAKQKTTDGAQGTARPT